MTENATADKPRHRLRELREAADQSYVEIAHALGLKSDKRIRDWENGADIPIWHARMLAQHFGVSLSFLLCDGHDEPKQAA